MINERMLEFLSLAEIMGSGIVMDGKEYNLIKLSERYGELAKELLSPYVINKDSKE